MRSITNSDGQTFTEAQVAEEWANDLDSGKYDQTSGGMVCNGAFCCLGVLERRTLVRLGFNTQDTDQKTFYPAANGWVVDLFGTPNVRLMDNTASYLNDTAKLTFPKIAECIRQQYNIEKVDNA